MRLATLALWFAAASPAQTYVVDAAMGPGANFSDIASAVAGVPDGASIEVRAGSYGNFTIDDKSLVVSGLPGARVVATILNVVVRNIPVAKSVTLRNLAFGSTGAPGAVKVHGCQGRVVVQSCTLVPSTTFTAPSIETLFATDVHFVDDVLVGSTTHSVLLQFSRAFLTGCTLQPVVNFSIGGILMSGSTCDVADTTITTLGIASLSSPIHTGSTYDRVRLRGGTILQTTTGQNSDPLISGDGTVWLDSAAQLISASPTWFSPALTVVPRAMPRVTAAAAPLGAPATATLTLPANAVGGLWFGLAASPTTLPAFATEILVDPLLVVAVTGGTATTQQATVTLPNLPWLRGVGLVWQGCSFDPANGWQASNAVVFTAW